MSNDPDDDFDDGSDEATPPERAWGFMENGVFVPVPKRPLLLGDADFQPPRTVELPGGKVRHIIEDPTP